MAMLFRDTGSIPTAATQEKSREDGTLSAHIGDVAEDELLPMGYVGPSQQAVKVEASSPSRAAEIAQPELAGHAEIDAQELDAAGTGGAYQGSQQSAATHNPMYSPQPEEFGVSGANSRSTRVLCVVNRKGGVGKTTTTFNLAGALAQMDQQVLVIDMDPMGSLCRSLGIYPDKIALSDLLIGTGGSMDSLIRPTHLKNLYVIPGDPNLRTFEMRHGTSVVYREALSDLLDEVLKSTPFPFVFIDCPPSLGLISGNAMTAANEAIVPVDGSTYGMGALMDTLGIIRLVRKNVNDRLSIAGLLLNNVNLGTVYDRTVLEVFKRRLRSAMFKSVIPSSPEADEASQLGEPVTSHAPNSWMSKAYWQLAKELLHREPSYAG
jgi:chromosome partitioning protein